MSLQGIDTVIIRVSNLEISKKWYTENLNLNVIWEDPILKLAVLETGGPTSLTIWQTDKVINFDRDTSSYPIFRTFDAIQLRKELIDKGVNVSELIEDSSVKYFLIYDPDGNVIEACQVIS